jgi:hypothetical protein
MLVRAVVEDDAVIRAVQHHENSAGTGSLVMEGLRSVAMAVSGVGNRAEPMRFSHAEPDKESFADAVAATYVRGIEMEARLCC